MPEAKELKLAVLIDADNIPYANVMGMLDEIAKYGIPSIKRIYGDWTNTGVSGWKSVLLKHAITPIQQYGYTKGKNATDSAMIIDAMDILHNQDLDGFCLVSSDSDFTRLATRLRESGKLVIGIGEKKTPQPFIVACDKFIYIEILASEAATKRTEKSKSIAEDKSVPDVEPIGRGLIKLLKNTISDVADEDGWASLAGVGALLNKKKADFDPRNYGFQKLTPLIKSLTQYIEVDERDTGKHHIKHIYVRTK
tara:strand:- start:7875 stop:8630 length:756 start_codon:yes stop_codon:yes gene_type:complete